MLQFGQGRFLLGPRLGDRGFQRAQVAIGAALHPQVVLPGLIGITLFAFLQVLEKLGMTTQASQVNMLLIRLIDEQRIPT